MLCGRIVSGHWRHVNVYSCVSKESPCVQISLRYVSLLLIKKWPSTGDFIASQERELNLKLLLMLTLEGEVISEKQKGARTDENRPPHPVTMVYFPLTAPSGHIDLNM